MKIFSKQVLLLLFLSFTLSCSSKKSEGEHQNLNQNTNGVMLDSIKIVYKLPKRGECRLSFLDRYVEKRKHTLDFVNTASRDSSIVKVLPKILPHEVFSSFGIVRKNGKLKFLRHYFLTLDGTVNLELKDEKGDTKVMSSENVIMIDSLFYPYEELGLELVKFGKLQTSKEIAISRLDSLQSTIFINEKSKYHKLLYNISYINYLNILQYIDPKNEKIKAYISENYPLRAGNVRELLYYYVKNNIYSIDFEKMDSTSEHYQHNLAKGLCAFLSFEDNKGRKEYRHAKEWFETTDFYKKDSINIAKEIRCLDSDIFKEKLQKISLLDTENKPVLFPSVVTKYPNDYYLLDFWATWCKPCVEGIKTIHSMKIPSNVSVINLSVNKLKEKEKWRHLSKQLNIDIGYLLKETKGNKDFLKYIELKSIPRYILIDKDMNLLYQAFYRPNEMQFLYKLKQISSYNEKN